MTTPSTAGTETQSARSARHPNSWFWVWTTTTALIGLGIRVAAVAGRPNRSAGGDAYYYHYAANLLVEGHGFITPFLYYVYPGHLHGLSAHPLHEQVQTAAFPPLFVWTLASAALVGFKSYFAQRMWCAVIGAGAVVICAMAGREIGGRRVGVLTGLVVAVDPNVWMSDEPALSETITPLLIGLILWSTYRFWKRPTMRRAAFMAGCVGVAALGRDELSILFVLIVIPICLMARDTAWRRRSLFLGMAVATVVVAVGPWVGYNMSRFKDPVFISDGLGVTLASADCNATFDGGPFMGYWNMPCAFIPVPAHDDESQAAALEQNHAVKFLKTHLNRLVPATLAKLGRGFAFFRPLQQIQLDSLIEGRPYRWALVGLWSYYGLFAVSLFGLVVLIRRRVTVLPLCAVTLAVIVSMALTFGNTRYRTPFEVVLAILAAVAVDGLFNVLRRRTPESAVPSDPPDPASSELTPAMVP